MKRNTTQTVFTCLTLIIALMACDSSSHDSQHHAELSLRDISQSPKAIVPENLFSNNLPESAIPVIAAKEYNQPGKELFIKGVIGGRVVPFSANRASFILCDESIKTCDKIPGDDCPTPWDACCEDRKKLLQGSLSIQVLDKNNSLIHGNLNGVGGLNPGSKVKLLGVVDSQSLPQAMLVNAVQIQKL